MKHETAQKHLQELKKKNLEEVKQELVISNNLQRAFKQEIEGLQAMKAAALRDNKVVIVPKKHISPKQDNTSLRISQSQAKPKIVLQAAAATQTDASPAKSLLTNLIIARKA